MQNEWNESRKCFSSWIRSFISGQIWFDFRFSTEPISSSVHANPENRARNISWLQSYSHHLRPFSRPIEFSFSRWRERRQMEIRVVGKGSWKEREVGKFKMNLERLKLESSSWNWKVRDEVGKLEVKLKSSSWSWKALAEVEKYNWSWKI